MSMGFSLTVEVLLSFWLFVVWLLLFCFWLFCSISLLLVKTFVSLCKELSGLIMCKELSGLIKGIFIGDVISFKFISVSLWISF
jgi:hypothetical protein